MTISLLSASNMSRHNKRKMPVKLKSFSGILVGNYLSLIPNCGVLAQLYLLAPIQNAVVERTFSFQNLILSAQRNRLLQGCSFLADFFQSLQTVHFPIIPIWINVHTKNQGDLTIFKSRARLFHLGTENQIYPKMTKFVTLVWKVLET